MKNIEIKYFNEIGKPVPNTMLLFIWFILELSEL